MSNLKPLSDEDAQRLHALLVEAGTILGAGPLGMVNATPAEAPIRRKMEVFAEHHLSRMPLGPTNQQQQSLARELVDGLLRIMDTDPVTIDVAASGMSIYRSIISRIRAGL